jgi:hypothetical protein
MHTATAARDAARLTRDLGGAREAAKTEMLPLEPVDHSTPSESRDSASKHEAGSTQGTKVGPGLRWCCARGGSR